MDTGSPTTTSVHMAPMSDLQTIIDRHAAATPGPHFVDVIDPHAGPEGKEWLICNLSRERYGNNAVHFGEDEQTARFVAAAFTDVPAMASALQRAEAHVQAMELILGSITVTSQHFQDAIIGLRKALALDGGR